MTDHPSPALPSRVATWVLAGVCVAMVGFYALLAVTRNSELGNRTAAEAYYNRLVEGFRAGQLSLRQEAPAGLAALADPYDPEANGPFRGVVYTDTNRIHDLTFFRGKLYLYFGVTPALLLFWPAVGLTGHYVSHQLAVALFAAAGFLLGVGLLAAIRRCCFPQTSPWTLVAGALALGLANGFPITLSRPDVWEVPIFCGYALSMLTLVLLWRALLRPESRARWLALASLAFGLAIGSRPSLFFGAAILLLPVVRGWSSGWRERRRLLAAAVLPIAAIGIGLMVYNQLRFGSPFEFGQTYQIAGERQDRGHFGLQHLGFNLWAYFLAPAQWSAGFPFVEPGELPALPRGHGIVEGPYAVLVMAPFTWLALAWCWLRRIPVAAERTGLALFLSAPAWLFVTSTALLGCFYGTCNRYQIEFVPALVLLAAVGLFALEAGLAGNRVGLRLARLGSGAALVFSIAFNLLMGAERRAQSLTFEGAMMVHANRVPEALPLLEQATRLKPGLGSAQMMLALAYGLEGRRADVTERVGEAVRRNPGRAGQLYENYGQSLAQVGQPGDLLMLLDAALKETPGLARLHYESAMVLAGADRLVEALPHFEAAARLDPTNPANLANLGAALAQAGRQAEARAALEQALRLNPNLPGVREILGGLPAAGAPPPFLRR
jgi:Tfp pilus assembly protein PilF